MSSKRDDGADRSVGKPLCVSVKTIVPLRFLLPLLIVTSVLRAQDVDLQVPFHVSWGEPQEVAALPAHIKAPHTGLALMADFDHQIEAGTVPVYLINKSGKDIVLETQDGDPYLKLE